MPRSNNFLDLGPSYLRSHVSYAWQDPSPVERGMVKRRMLEEAQRRHVPGVAGQRLRAQYGGSGRMFTSPAKVRLGSGDDQGYLSSALPSRAPDAPDPPFGEALYGHSMRVQSASPTLLSNAPGISNGICKGTKKSMVEPQASQRPHTACTPAVERHLRRYTRCMSAGNSAQQRSPDVFSCAERPTGRFGSLSAGGELVARPGTPVTGIVSQGVAGAWGRHVGATAADGSERRPGRSKSTEPSLLGKLTSSLDNTVDAADSMTAVIKSGARTKIKAAVDCWWDEQHLGGSTQRNTSSSGSASVGVRRGSLQRSHSAGQRKSHTGSSKSNKVGDRVKGSSSRTIRPRSSSLTSQARKNSSKSGEGNSNSSRQGRSASYREGNDSGSNSAGPQGRSSVVQPEASSTGTTNSLVLISKLALPDTAASYLALGKHSLSSALEAASRAPGDSKVVSEEDRSRAGLEPITLTVASGNGTTSRIDESKAEVESATGCEPVQHIKSQGTETLQAAEAQLGSSQAHSIRTWEITALQDITHKFSDELGMTREWFAEFCEQLVDEWESDSEDVR